MSTPMPLSPFITDPDNRFVLNEAEFFAAIISTNPADYQAGEPMPALLADPAPAYLNATQIRPIVDVLAGHM